MQEYTYYFADRTKTTIQISKEWKDVLDAMDKAERRKTYNYDRHNYPLSQADYEGETFSDNETEPFEMLMRRTEKEKFDAAINTLTEKQRELIQKRYNKRMKVMEIAEQEGVDPTAITHRLERIENKLEKFFVRTVSF